MQQWTSALPYLDQLGQWHHGDEEEDGAPVSIHGHGGGAPTEGVLCPALYRAPSIPDDALQTQG